MQGERGKGGDAFDSGTSESAAPVAFCFHIKSVLNLLSHEKEKHAPGAPIEYPVHPFSFLLPSPGTTTWKINWINTYQVMIRLCSHGRQLDSILTFYQRKLFKRLPNALHSMILTYSHRVNSVSCFSLSFIQTTSKNTVPGNGLKSSSIKTVTTQAVKHAYLFYLNGAIIIAINWIPPARLQHVNQIGKPIRC